MNKKFCIRFFLFACLLIIAIGCNRKNHEVDKTLDRANALMTEHPDSALALIEKIDTSGLDRSRMARYGLLLTKAQNKNYITPENDSLILKAVEYYRGMDNNDEMQALYYYGDLSYTYEIFDRALVYLHLANDMAKEQKDYFYGGLSARALASLYKQLYVYEKALAYGKESQKTFEKYEKELNDGTTKYSKWLDIMIAGTYLRLDQPEKALEISNNPDSVLLEDDSYFKRTTIQNRAKSFHLLKRYNEAIDQYGLIKKEGFQLTGEDWCGLCHDLYNSGHKSEALAALDSARLYVRTDPEQSYLKMIESYIFADAGNHKRAYDVTRDWADTWMEKSDKLLENPNTLPLVDSYRSQAQIQKDLAKSERNKNLLLILTIICIIGLIVTLILYYRSRIKNKQLKISNLEANERILQNKLKTLTDEFELLEENLRLKDNEKKPLSDSVKTGLKNRFKDLEDVCVSIFKTPTHALNIDALPDWAQKQYKRIRSESSLSSYDSMIDIYSEGYMDYVIGLFPNVRTDKIRLIRYLYVGFSMDMILFLLGKKSRDWVDKTKYSIKMTILTKVDRATAADILHQLRIKP